MGVTERPRGREYMFSEWVGTFVPICLGSFGIGAVCLINTSREGGRKEEEEEEKRTRVNTIEKLMLRYLEQYLDRWEFISII